MTRSIFHVDMDAFYASVEQRDHPEYRGLPVIVGANPRKGSGRGVVAACSYEARQHGIHSALPISKAYRLCPDGIYVRPNMQRYKEVSGKIREIFRQVTDLVEPLSIDEAFLDVTDQVEGPSDAWDLAKKLKRQIQDQEQLSSSIGVGPSKFIAKIASDLEKPDGLVLVRENQVQSFLDPLPISRLWGVGPRTEEKLRELEIFKIEDLRRFKRRVLRHRFGKHGDHLWRLANGIDDRPVITERTAKSVSQEKTFLEDTNNSQELESVLAKLSKKVAERVEKVGVGGRTVTLKLRYSDFTTLTRQASFRDLVHQPERLFSIARTLLEDNWNGEDRIRLIGVGLSSLDALDSYRQLRLF